MIQTFSPCGIMTRNDRQRQIFIFIPALKKFTSSRKEGFEDPKRNGTYLSKCFHPDLQLLEEVADLKVSLIQCYSPEESQDWVQIP